jgi:hypothetical protein
MRRIIAALNPPRPINDFIAHAKLIARNLAIDPIFASPTLLLAGFEADVAALDAAELDAAMGGTGQVAARDAQRVTVRSGLIALRSYVQSVANANPADAAAIVVRSGMSVKNVAGPKKAPFVVKQGPVTGSAHAYARAARTRASYEWQCSLGGVGWVDIAPTVKADAEFRGLAAGRRYFFRYRCVSKAGVSDWSDVVCLIVR